MAKHYLGLALGGGGARGAAHIGAIQVMHKAGIRPDLIAGTSAGSTIGAMYAATLDPFWVEERFRSFMHDKSFKMFNSGSLMDGRNKETFLKKATLKVKQNYMVALGLNRSFVVKREALEQAIDFLVPIDSFSDLKIPLKILATNIQTGDDCIHEHGNLKDAVIQSSSIPGFFEPTYKDNMIIVDGGVTSPIPVSLLKTLTKIVMAIDITNYTVEPMKNPNLIEIVRRADIITSMRLKEKISKEADILIRPEVLGLHWSDFKEFDKLIECGRLAAENTVQTILKSRPEKSHIYYNLFASIK